VFHPQNIAFLAGLFAVLASESAPDAFKAHGHAFAYRLFADVSDLLPPKRFAMTTSTAIRLTQ
jgi:hypothetical protein